MSKEIIVDGVDVSGCTYYDANADKESAFLFDCKREHAPCWSCASMPGCLYKKYKRKEQECEDLKKLYEEVCSENLKEIYELIKKNDLWREIVNVVNGKLEKQVDQLKKANDEKNELLAQLGCPTVGTARRLTLSLKEQIDKLKVENEELKKQLTILDDEDVVVEITAKQFEEYKKYKRTLIEIKEIAEPRIVHGLTDMEYVNIYSKTMEQILQKIRECEVGNDMENN